MKPTLAKPKIIMAHVDASGTAAVNAASRVSEAWLEERSAKVISTHGERYCIREGKRGLIGQVFRFGRIKRVDAILPQIDQDVVISLQLTATHDRWFEEPVALHAFPR